MSLLSVDLSKRRRLSLKKPEPQPPKRSVKPPAPKPVGKPPTIEEVAYSQLVALHPIVEDLVEIMDLVSPTTGERIRKVEPTGLDSDRLRELAQQVLQPSAAYTLEEVIEQVASKTNVSRDRAYTGFIYMLQAGAIQVTPASTYYLADSTPF